MKTTKEQVIALARLYEQEDERRKLMEAAKLQYEGLRQSYDAVCEQIDIAELRLEGSSQPNASLTLAGKEHRKHENG